MVHLDLHAMELLHAPALIAFGASLEERDHHPLPRLPEG
jgi:hypothetical protein